MAFVKANLSREKEELEKLVAESKEARKAYKEFQAKIASKEQLIRMQKAENVTHR